MNHQNGQLAPRLARFAARVAEQSGLYLFVTGAGPKEEWVIMGRQNNKWVGTYHPGSRTWTTRGVSRVPCRDVWHALDLAAKETGQPARQRLLLEACEA
jgi:hypothetical protein